MNTIALLLLIIALLLFGLSAGRFITDKISLIAAGLGCLAAALIFLNWNTWGMH